MSIRSEILARRGRRPHLAVLVAAASFAVLVLAPSTALAADGTVSFVSGTDWTADDADPAVGPVVSLPASAQHVCLNPSAPSPCPAGATEYGWAGVGWGASLSAIPGATWIWAPGIDATSAPADEDAYGFSKTINIPGTPTDGWIGVAADDGSTVFVNGSSAGGASSPSSLVTIDITSLLVEGDNTIRVVGRNGLVCNEECSYRANPGGVVFGGEISYSTEDPGPTDPGDGGSDDPSVGMPETSTVSPVPGAGARDQGLIMLAMVVGLAAAVSAGTAMALRTRRGR